MIGVILCTHSTFADGLKNAVEMIAGEQHDFESICFMNGDDPEVIADKMETIMNCYEEKNIPTCIIVDMFAATPFNVALRKCIEKGAYVITGANLPLMLNVLLSRETFDGVDLNSFLEECLDGVKESMKVFNPKSMTE